MFSLLLSVYKNENPKYLAQALTSIWDEQILKPAQIVMVKDGPLTPELDDEINHWQLRLGDIFTLVSLPENLGLGAALNIGLKACKYDLVARMDTDDVALAERFLKQVTFMNEHPEIAASSAILEEWDEALRIKQGIRILPTTPQDVLKFAKRRSPLSHPLVIYRKNIICEVGGYPALRKAQDHALWSLLLSKGYHLANLPDVLLKMRTGNQLLGRRGWAYFKQEYQVLKYQKEIDFISKKDFIINSFLKCGLRLSPTVVKRWVYKLAR